MADKHLDTRGLNCPLPILKLKRALGDTPAGCTLEVLATDPGSVEDFKAYCERTKDEILEHAETDGYFRFLIRRTAA